MNEEIRKKIHKIKSKLGSETKDLQDELLELEKLIKSEGQQEKPGCDFLPGQIIKVWDNVPECLDVDIFKHYNKNEEYPIKCHRAGWKYAEPIPLENYIATIAHNMPNAVKAEIAEDGDIYFYNKHEVIITNFNGQLFRAPYPNNTGEKIEIEIKR